MVTLILVSRAYVNFCPKSAPHRILYSMFRVSSALTLLVAWQEDVWPVKSHASILPMLLPPGTP